MNELTKQLQEIMVPKAALIAYEYQEGHYASGSHYLELRPINKKGRMEAGIPVTYEFMDSLVESYSDGNRRIPHGWLPPNMLWCDTRRGHESYVWYNPPGKRRMFFKNDLNIGDGMFHVPGVIYIIKNERMDIFAYKGKKPDGRTPLYLAPFFNVTGGSVCLGNSTLEKPESLDFHTLLECKYSINSLVYWVTYVHNVVYSFYRSMIYCYINSTQRCAGSIVIDIIPTNGADKRKFFPFAPYFPVTNVIKRYFYPYFPAIIGIKGYSFPYFPYLSGIMKIKTALYSLFSRLDWHKTVVFPCLGEIYEGIRSLSWEIPVT